MHTPVILNGEYVLSIVLTPGDIMGIPDHHYRDNY